MDYKNYFNNTTGKGFLATSNKKGDVDVAIYSPPFVLDDDTFVFGMMDRLTHANLQENPHAAYAFNENGTRGKRFYLDKIKEATEGPILQKIKQAVNQDSFPGAGALVKFAVYFKVTKDLPLVIDSCKGEHLQHICELVSKGDFGKIKELANAPNFMCVNCGRLADKNENLCNPLSLDKVPFGLVG